MSKTVEREWKICNKFTLIVDLKASIQEDWFILLDGSKSFQIQIFLS